MILYPRLNCQFFKRSIPSFLWFGVLGFVFGVLLGLIIARWLQLNEYIVLLMTLAGAATFFGLTFLSKWITGGETIVYYHHEITIMMLCAVTLYFLKVPILPYLDIAILGIGTFLAFGRIGCYSVGCCHGRPYKHGVKYGQQHVDAGFTWYYKDVPLLPVQLIESVYVFLTVIGCVILLLKHTTAGTVVIIYTVVYGLMRYALEFFRGDPERALRHGLSEAQWTTLALTAITFAFSRFQWLPAYLWHWMVLVIMLIVAVITIYYFHHGNEQKLFSPPHIRQLAEGLDMLDEVNSKPQTRHKEVINVYTTRTGLSISCNKPQTGAVVKHYTISLKSKTTLRWQLADKIARLISTLRNDSNHYELIEKQNGVYHILFQKEREIEFLNNKNTFHGRKSTFPPMEPTRT